MGEYELVWAVGEGEGDRPNGEDRPDAKGEVNGGEEEMDDAGEDERLDGAGGDGDSLTPRGEGGETSWSGTMGR